MKIRRGFTLIELMITISIMLVATLAASSLMIAGVTLNRNAELRADESDNVRLAGMALAKAVSAAGLFTPGGIYVNVPSGTNTLISPVWTSAHNVNQPDDLWVIAPKYAALLGVCNPNFPGAAVAVTRPTPNSAQANPLPISVGCDKTLYAATPSLFCTDPTCSSGGAANAWLVVANMNTGALLTPTLTFATVAAGVASITSAESANSTFSDNPGTGFLAGDLVY